MVEENHVPVICERVTVELCGAQLQETHCILLKDHEGPHESRTRNGHETVRWNR